MAYQSHVTVRRDVVLRAGYRLPRRRTGRLSAGRHGAALRTGTHRHELRGVAAGLGWFSIGLGLAEVVAPRALTRMLGMGGRESLLQAYGVREIATGIGILASSNPAPWIWGRVGGDALDLLTLGAGLGEENPKRQNVAMAMVAVAGVTLVDATVAKGLTAPAEDPGVRRPRRDYSGRSGFPMPAEAMRGAASDFEVPSDMRTPELLRPWTS